MAVPHASINLGQRCLLKGAATSRYGFLQRQAPLTSHRFFQASFLGHEQAGLIRQQKHHHVLAASGGGGGGGSGGSGGKAVGEDDGGDGLPIKPVAIGLLVLLVAKKLYDVYMEKRGDPENPKDVGPGEVVGGFKDWLLSPFAGKEEEAPPEEDGGQSIGYIVAGSIFLLAVAAVKVFLGGEGGEGGEAADAAADAAGKAVADATAAVQNAAGQASSGARRN